MLLQKDLYSCGQNVEKNLTASPSEPCLAPRVQDAIPLVNNSFPISLYPPPRSVAEVPVLNLVVPDSAGPSCLKPWYITSDIIVFPLEVSLLGR